MTKNIHDCSFCSISEKNILNQAKFSICFKPTNALKEGHLIIATKRHVERFIELSDEEICDLFTLASQISKDLHKEIKEEKFYIVRIGDKVSHFHIHILPKKTTDTPLGPFIFSEKGWKSEIIGNNLETLSE